MKKLFIAAIAATVLPFLTARADSFDSVVERMLAGNPANVLRPTVLTFSDNTLLDLSLPENRDLHVVDIVKTLDNRHIMDTDTIIL